MERCAVKAFVGSCLLAVGIIVAGGTGLCALIILGTPFAGNVGNWLLMLLQTVIAPLAIGLVLIFAGRAMIRSARQRDE
jgi:hypothetical protein